jgi:hypothetical protein
MENGVGSEAYLHTCIPVFVYSALAYASSRLMQRCLIFSRCRRRGCRCQSRRQHQIRQLEAATCLPPAYLPACLPACIISPNRACFRCEWEEAMTDDRGEIAGGNIWISIFELLIVFRNLSLQIFCILILDIEESENVWAELSFFQLPFVFRLLSNCTNGRVQITMGNA